MKFNKSLVFTLLFVLLFLWSCTVVRINENLNYATSGFNFGTDKTAILITSDNIVVNEFSKTFNKRFKENSDFVHYHDSLLSVNFKKLFVFGEINTDQSVKFASDNLLILNKVQQNKVDSLFTSTRANYIIRVSDIEVTNSIQGTGPVFMGIPGGGMGAGGGMFVGGGQSESCIVNTKYQVYDVKSRKKVLDFVSQGSSGVLFLAFDKALRGAIDSSINNAATYLSSGKLKF